MSRRLIKRTDLWNPVLDNNCSKYVLSIMTRFDPVIMVLDLLIVIFLVVSGRLSFLHRCVLRTRQSGRYKRTLSPSEQ